LFKKLTKFLFFFQLNEKMNEMAAHHQSLISQKDKQLADYQKQVDTLQKAENELTKQIEEQKAKNNVS
jgi:seryl-tRNA synthetase